MTTMSPAPAPAPPAPAPAGNTLQRRATWFLRNILLPAMVLTIAPGAVGALGVGVYRLTGVLSSHWWLIAAGILLVLLMGSGETYGTAGSGPELASYIDPGALLREVWRSITRRNGGGGGGGFPPEWLRWTFLCLGVTGLLGMIGFAAARADLLETILRYNFVVSIVAVVAVLQFALHRSARTQMSWKKLADPWLKWNGISALGVGGFGVLGSSNVADALTSAVLKSRYLDLRLLVSAYLIALALMGVAMLAAAVGRTRAEKEEEYRPVRWFAPAFGFAWLGSVLFFALFFDSILLSFHAHLTLPPTG